MATETLQLYTTGDYLTTYLRGFLEEGRYKIVRDVMLEGGSTPELVEAFFRGEAEFLGDSRDDSLILQRCAVGFEFNDILLTGVLTSLETTENRRRGYSYFELKYAAKNIPDLQLLLEIIPYEEIIERTWKKMIEREGYSIATPNDTLYKGRTDSGVITPDGSYILCDYMGHRELYSLLAPLGIASDSDWTDDIKCIHVSSGSIHGNVANIIRDPEFYFERAFNNNATVTDAQIKTLFTYRSSIREVYSEFRRLTDNIRELIQVKAMQGGKYGNLAFLRLFYSDRINLPVFSTSLLDASYEKCFMRTSPKYSLPGLLNSRLMNNTQHDFDLMRNFIQHEFEKVKDLRKDNELHWFFQEFLEGENGVCHYYNKGEFEYSLSAKQGDVVKGVEGSSSLHPDLYNELRTIASFLYNDMQKPLQLEFVIHNNKVYIVQLRILENNADTTVLLSRPLTTIHQALTFSKGRIKVKMEDILIVDSEAESKELLGKKALIVRGSPNFSHILALSKALMIPSVYNAGNIDLSGYDEIEIVALNKEAFICKI